MEDSEDLAASLDTVFAVLGDSARDLRSSLRRFTVAAADAVPSFLGAVVEGTAAGVSLAVPWFEHRPSDSDGPAPRARASLLLRLPSPSDPAAPFTLTLFASAPGAFVDLAADLAWLTRTELSDFPLDQHLDSDVLRVSSNAAVESTINQAIGALMELNGIDTSQAQTELAKRAQAQRCTRLEMAAQVLRRLQGGTTAGPPTG